MKRKLLPTQEYLLSRLLYNPESGELLWKSRPREQFTNDRTYAMWNARFAGNLALDYVSIKGYKMGAIDYANYQAHRVIWKTVTGEEPTVVIDHVDRNTLNNRWVNLRSATCAGSTHNRLTCSFMGVDFYKNKWRAKIMCGGKHFHLGMFASREEALAARIAAEKHYFKEFSPR